MPYTYLIGWSKLDKWYYGVRVAKNSHPHDLWKTYFTSSAKVKQLRTIIGEPDVIEIRKVFDCPKKAALFEHKVISRMKCMSSSKWLNMSNGVIYRNGGQSNISEITKQKISESMKVYNESLSDDYKKKRSSVGGTAFWNKVQSDPNLAYRISQARKSQTNPMLGKRQKLKTCIICDRSVPVNVFSRHLCKK